jgi:hypothetical protein
LSAPGWFPDPTGRFGQRWYDGTAWTGDVVGANGQVIADPLARVAEQPAYQPNPYLPAQPPPPGWVPPSPGAVRYAPGPGLLLGLAGLVCVALSLFALKWADVEKGTFLNLGSQARKVGSDNYPYTSVYLYAAWAGFVLFAVAVFLIVAAGLPVPRSATGNTYNRVLGSVVAGGAAVLQTVVIVKLFKGPASPQFGAWLGVAGYLVAVAGLTLGARRRTA